MTIARRMNPEITDLLQARLERFEEQIAELNERVREEHKQVKPDTSLLRSLRLERLRFKEKIHRYAGVLRTLARGQSAKLSDNK